MSNAAPPIQPAQGKLGVLLVGLGPSAARSWRASSSSRRAWGNRSARSPARHHPPRQAHGQAHAADSRLRAARRHRRPGLRRVGHFSRHRVRGGGARRRTEAPLLEAVRAELEALSRGPACSTRVRQALDGTYIKRGGSKLDMAHALMRDIEAFRTATGVAGWS